MMISMLNSKRRGTITFKLVISIVLVAVIVTSMGIRLPRQGASAEASELSYLPGPTSLINTSPEYNLPRLQGIRFYYNNPFEFEFFIDEGNTHLTKAELKEHSSRLISYFLASLTIPEEDLWVNLSPYEKEMIIPQELGLTEMGRDMLGEDYILKQLVASLTYPESTVGKKFWEKVYKRAYQLYGTIEIPLNTFNKIWIVPEKAVVHEKFDKAVIADTKLKVMLEEDYLALQKNKHSLTKTKNLNEGQVKEISNFSSQIMKEVILPVIEEEVNEGKNFAYLRQIYNSLVLATWFKQKLKTSLLNKIYANQKKIQGINSNDPQIKEKIYRRYVEAFQKGVYNYIKRDYDAQTSKYINRRYFSGGLAWNSVGEVLEVIQPDKLPVVEGVRIRGNMAPVGRGIAVLAEEAPGVAPQRNNGDQKEQRSASSPAASSPTQFSTQQFEQSYRWFQLTNKVKPHPHDVEFSANGKFMHVMPSDRTTYAERPDVFVSHKLYDYTTGEDLEHLIGTGVLDILFAPRNLSVVRYAGGKVKFFDLEQREELTFPSLEDSRYGRIERVRLVDEGRKVAVGYRKELSRDKNGYNPVYKETIKIFDLTQRKEIKGLLLEDVVASGFYSGYGLSPTGRYLLVRFRDRNKGSVMVDFRQGRLVLEYERSVGARFANNERLVYLGDLVYRSSHERKDLSVSSPRLVDLQSGEDITAVLGENINRVVVSEDSPYVFVALYGKGEPNELNYIINVESGRRLNVSFDANVSSLTFAPGGRHAFIEYDNHPPQLIDLETKGKTELQLGIDRIAEVGFSSDDKFLNVRGYQKVNRLRQGRMVDVVEGLATVIDIERKENLKDLLGEDAKRVYFSPNARYAVVACRENLAKIVDLQQKKAISTGFISIHEPVFSDNNRYVSLGYRVGNHEIFDLEKLASLEGVTGRVNECRFPSGGEKILFWRSDELSRTAKLYDPQRIHQDAVSHQLYKRWGDSAYLGFYLISVLTAGGVITTAEDYREYVFFLLPMIEEINSSTTGYNRQRLLNLFTRAMFERETSFGSKTLVYYIGFIPYLLEKGGDVRRHLSFCLNVIRHNKRLAVPILEGIFDAVGRGHISIALSEGEQAQIQEFISLTHGFNPELYKVYLKEGKDEVLKLFNLSAKMLDDEVSAQDMMGFVNAMKRKGYDGEEVLLAVTQRAIPTSGASFVRRKETKRVFEDYLNAGDRRGDVPQSLHSLGRFGGGTIERFEWKLRSGMESDPEREVSAIIDALHYPDSGKASAQREQDIKFDRRRCIEALREYIIDRGNVDKRQRALAAFLSYARHSDQLKEKLEQVNTQDYVGLDLLDQLFRDKDNLTVLLGEILDTELRFEGRAGVRAPQKFVRGLEAQWGRGTDANRRNAVILKRLASIKSDEIRSKVLTAQLPLELRALIEEMLSQRLPVMVGRQQLAEDLFATPINIIEREKSKFEQVVSSESVKLKFRVVKGPAYGLYGLNAGVCIARDIALWNKKEFYLLAMIDEVGNEAVGFVHLFQKRIGDKLYLTVPGINPSTEFLGQVKAEEVYPLIEKALAAIGDKGKFDAVVIPRGSNVLSNRKDIAVLVKKAGYREETLDSPVEWNTVPQGYPFEDIYVLWEKQDMAVLADGTDAASSPILEWEQVREDLISLLQNLGVDSKMWKQFRSGDTVAIKVDDPIGNAIKEIMERSRNGSYGKRIKELFDAGEFKEVLSAVDREFAQGRVGVREAVLNFGESVYLGGNRKRGEGKTLFIEGNFEVWIEVVPHIDGASVLFRLSVQNDQVKLQQYDEKFGSPVADAKSVEVGQEVEVGRADVIDRFDEIKVNLISREHFSVLVIKNDSDQWKVIVKDLESRHGTRVELDAIIDDFSSSAISSPVEEKKAFRKRGGIDLSSNHFDIEIKGESIYMPFKNLSFDTENFGGFTFRITSIERVQDWASIEAVAEGPQT